MHPVSSITIDSTEKRKKHSEWHLKVYNEWFSVWHNVIYYWLCGQFLTYSIEKIEHQWIYTISRTSTILNHLKGNMCIDFLTNYLYNSPWPSDCYVCRQLPQITPVQTEKRQPWKNRNFNWKRVQWLIVLQMQLHQICEIL